MLATEGTWREAQDAADEWRALVPSALVASLVLLLVVSIFVLARRWSGALTDTLAPLPLVLTAAVLVAWALAVKLRLRDSRTTLLAAAVLVLFAVGFSFPGERVIDWLVWLSALAVLGLVSTKRYSPAIDSDKASETVLQELTRTRGVQGVETIAGTIAAEFAPGERLAVLHVAFCPPFERLPSVDCEAAAGPACDAKVAQILHQGARVEVRLARASTAEEHVEIEFVASDSGPASA